MRIHEIIDAIPENTPYLYICHAPTGLCRVLSADGGVYQSTHVNDQRELAPALAVLFDSHWRGANAQEIAAYPWNGPRVMRTVWTTPDDERERRVLTEADARADLAGTPRPDNPSAGSPDG